MLIYNGKVYFYGTPNLGTEPWLITIGDNVHITKHLEFITHDGGVLIFRKDVLDLEIIKPITIKNNVYIGINTIILPGVSIGTNFVIWAGAVITKNIPSNSVVEGARSIKTTEEYFNKIQDQSLNVGHLSVLKKRTRIEKNFLKEVY